MLAEGALFCREYIARRLRAGELLPQHLEDFEHDATLRDACREKWSDGAEWLSEPNAARCQCRAVSNELQAAGEQLDALYPDLYDSLTGQLEVSSYSVFVFFRLSLI